jgi:hypothetical protein
VINWCIKGETRMKEQQGKEVPPIKYRHPEVEKAVVGFIFDRKSRESFLSNRDRYLGQFNIPQDAREALKNLTDEQIAGLANEFEHNFMGAGETESCGRSTFADLYCDS